MYAGPHIWWAASKYMVGQIQIFGGPDLVPALAQRQGQGPAYRGSLALWGQREGAADLSIRQARNDNIRHQVTTDFARVKRILTGNFKSSSGRLGLEATRTYDGVIKPRCFQIVLSDQLFVKDAAEGVGDNKTSRLLLTYYLQMLYIHISYIIYICIL